jgi:hypothetical protein
LKFEQKYSELKLFIDIDAADIQDHYAMFKGKLGFIEWEYLVQYTNLCKHFNILEDIINFANV